MKPISQIFFLLNCQLSLNDRLSEKKEIDKSFKNLFELYNKSSILLAVLHCSPIWNKMASKIQKRHSPINFLNKLRFTNRSVSISKVGPALIKVLKIQAKYLTCFAYWAKCDCPPLNAKRRVFIGPFKVVSVTAPQSKSIFFFVFTHDSCPWGKLYRIPCCFQEIQPQLLWRLMPHENQVPIS